MRQELFHHANLPAQIDFNLASDVFEASGFVVNIDLTHDASVVDQNVELGKLFGDLFVKSGDRFRIGNVASKGVKFWKGRFRTVHLRLIAALDKNPVTKGCELFGEFVTDAAGAAGDQDRIAREFHDFSSLDGCDSCVRVTAYSAFVRCSLWQVRSRGYPVVGRLGNRYSRAVPTRRRFSSRRRRAERRSRAAQLGRGWRCRVVRTRPSPQTPR